MTLINGFLILGNVFWFACFISARHEYNFKNRMYHNCLRRYLVLLHGMEKD